ncbi:hypothetical protein D3C87_1350430 [compost metagenome]
MPDAHSEDREKQRAVHQRDGGLQERDHAHLLVNRAQEAIHGFAGIALLAPGMGEELDRGDIGVAVDDPAGHQRTGIGLRLGNLAQARDEITQQPEITGQPDNKGQSQPRIAHEREDDRAGEIDDHVDGDVENLHDHFAHGKGGLHQLGANAACKLVLEIAHGLADEIAMRHPADALGKVAQQRLVDDHCVGHLQQRNDQQQEHAHAGQLPALVDEKGLAVGRAQPIDDRSHEAEQHDLERRDGSTQNGHGSQPALGAVAIVQTKGQQALGRLYRLGLRIGIDPFFKPVQHCS